MRRVGSGAIAAIVLAGNGNAVRKRARDSIGIGEGVGKTGGKNEIARERDSAIER